MKNKGDNATITTPWHDTPQQGKIIEVFETKAGSYYVVEFSDGTKWTAKESDLPKIIASEATTHILTRNETRDFKLGYLSALYVHDIIEEKEYEKYYNALYEGEFV